MCIWGDAQCPDKRRCPHFRVWDNCKRLLPHNNNYRVACGFGGALLVWYHRNYVIGIRKIRKIKCFKVLQYQ